MHHPPGIPCKIDVDHRNSQADVEAICDPVRPIKNIAVGVSLALPVINVNLAGDARGVVQSFTFIIPDSSSQHQFGDDDLHPEFDKTVRYSESATGLGDLALRFKYNMLRSDRMQMAGLLDMRLPTGDEQNFLGNGKPNTRISWIMSNKAGQGTTHFNIGYERRGAELDSDELEIALGFDQLLLPGLTIAGDFVGEIDLNTDEAIELLPGYRKITDQPGDGASRVRDIDLSNIPERDNDNTFDLSLGMRVAASEQFSLLGNILVPLNEGGLRSTLTATIGVSVIL